MKSKELYQASRINSSIKNYIRNNVSFPKTLCSLEEDVMQIIDNISPGRERAYLIKLSSELSDFNDENIVGLLGIIVEMQVIAAYVKDDILDNNRRRNNQFTVNCKYNAKIATIYSDIFLSISYSVLEKLRQLVTDVYYKDIISKINESYQSICFGQIETTCFNYSNSNLISSICSLYERLVGIAYGHYCSMLVFSDNNLKDQLFLFGKNIGIALQIKNDISDFIIDPSVSGIPAYQDLLQSHPNVIIAYLLEYKEHFLYEESCLLNRLLSCKYDKEELDQEDEAILLGMLNKSNAISKSVSLFNDFLNNCLVCISSIKDVNIRSKYTGFIETLIYE